MWLAAHDNFAPLVIITTADPAVVCVVADVFPNASHIWSLYHLIAIIFKNCRGAVRGAIGQLVVDFLTVSKTMTKEAFHARCDPHPFPYISLSLLPSMSTIFTVSYTYPHTFMHVFSNIGYEHIFHTVRHTWS
jgi:hypothetical protein